MSAGLSRGSQDLSYQWPVRFIVVGFWIFTHNWKEGLQQEVVHESSLWGDILLSLCCFFACDSGFHVGTRQAVAFADTEEVSSGCSGEFVPEDSWIEASVAVVISHSLKDE